VGTRWYNSTISIHLTLSCFSRKWYIPSPWSTVHRCPVMSTAQGPSVQPQMQYSDYDLTLASWYLGCDQYRSQGAIAPPPPLLTQRKEKNALCARGRGENLSMLHTILVFLFLKNVTKFVYLQTLKVIAHSHGKIILEGASFTYQ